MIRLSTMKPFTIGRQVYVLNEKPDNIKTVVYPLTDSPIVYDAVLKDIFQTCNRIVMRQTECAFVPKKIFTHIDSFSVRATIPFNDVCSRLLSKFKNLKKIKFNISSFNRFNAVHESESILSLIRDRVFINSDRKFRDLVGEIFRSLSEYDEYENKYILIPLDYTKVPLNKNLYRPQIYKDRNTSMAALLILYMKMYPQDFIQLMQQNKATLVFYSKFGVFRLSYKDILESVITSKAEGLRFEYRDSIKLYGECQEQHKDIFYKLYSESYAIKEDKLADATIVAIRRLKGEGILSQEEFDSSDDVAFHEGEEDIKVSKDDEDLKEAIEDAIGEDIEVDAKSPATLQVQDNDVKDTKVVIGVSEKNELDRLRVKEIKTTKQEVKNAKLQAQAQVVNDLTDSKSSEEEIELAEKIADGLVGTSIDNAKALHSMKKLKEIKLARTRPLSMKEKAYLKKIEVTSVEQAAESLEDLKLESTVLKNVDALDDIAENKYMNFNKTYSKKLKKKDMEACMNHFAYVRDYPLYKTAYSVTDTSTRFDHKETLKIQFKDIDGKAQNITLDRPLLHNGNKMRLNGTNMELQTQRIINPLVYLNGSVMMSMNYNKAFADVVGGRYITKQESIIARFANKVLSDPELKTKVKVITWGTVEESDMIEKAMEFTRIGKYIYSIKKDDDNFINFKNEDNIAIFGNLFVAEEYLLRVGKYKGREVYINRNLDAIEYYNDETEANERMKVGDFIIKIIEEWEDKEIVTTLNSINKDSSLAYSAIKIMSKRIPIILILSYTNGLDEVLERSGVEYELIYEDKKPKVDILKYNLIQFQDCYLKYSIDDPQHSLLFSGLRQYDLSQYRYDEFCDTSKGIAADFISEIGNGNLPLYVTSFEMCFVDPISQAVLRDYDLPTDFMGVLLYANMMLASDIRMSDNDMRLYRLRSAEIIEAVTYKVLADAYVNYHIAKKRGSRNAKLEIPRDAVIKEIYELGNVQTYSVVNPMTSALSTCKMTVKGLSGLNLDRGITLEKRLVDPSSAGIRAMPSVYTGGIGIVQQTSIDPNIVSARGYLKVCENDDEVNALSAKNLLSPTELMTPGTTTEDDGQRIYLNYQQKGHAQGINEPSLCSVTNGYDEMIGYQAREFCHYMEKDGVVTKITPDYVFVKYNDGTDDAFKLDQVERHAAKAKYLDNTMNVMSNIKVGTKLKAQDPIAYNRYMFVEYDGKPIYCTGRVMNVLFMSAPEVYEDATIISESASSKLSSYVQKAKVITMKKNTIVKQFISKPYTKVKATDPLLSHAIMSTDDALNSLLGDNPDNLDASLIKEKTAGTSGVIKAINVFYCCPKEELSNSLKRLVNEVEKEYSSRGDGDLDNKNMDSYKRQSISRIPIRVPEGTKVANKKIYKDDVIIEYIIQAYSKVSHADKVTYFNALKGETSKVLPDEMMPVGTVSGIRVDCMMSPASPMKRKVMSIIKVGATERLIYEVMRISKEKLDRGKSPNNINEIKKFILKALLVAEGGDEKKAKNYVQYKDALGKMSESEFVKFINTGILRVKVIPAEYGLELKNIIKAMEEVVGLPLEERVTIPFLYGDPEIGDIISDKKQTILRVPVIKLMQTALGENRYVSSISTRDKSNQVVNDSKGGSLSDVETSMLLSSGYENVIKEFFTFRADNDIAKKEAYSNIALSGQTNIPEAPTEGKVALKYITACYVGMGIDPEFIEED